MSEEITPTASTSTSEEINEPTTNQTEQASEMEIEDDSTIKEEQQDNDAVENGAEDWTAELEEKHDSATDTVQNQSNSTKKKTIKTEIAHNRSRKRKCSVPGCSNKNVVTAHRIPAWTPDITLQWQNVLQLDKYSTSASVCDIHFLPTDYIPRYDNALPKKLKRTAVPSQYILAESSNPSQSKSIRRIKLNIARRERRERREFLKPPNTVKNGNTESPPVKLARIANSRSSSNSTPDKSIKILDGKSVKKKSRRESVIPKHLLQHNYSTHPEDIEDDVTKEFLNTPRCVCNKEVVKESKKEIAERRDLKAARVLLELNEQVAEMSLHLDLVLAVKSSILNVGEQFYHAIRKYQGLAFKTLLKTDFNLYSYTGVNFEIFHHLKEAMKICEDDYSGIISVENRVLMCLIKIRLNLSFSSISNIFQISEEHCKESFFPTLKCLKCILSSAIHWPTNEEVMEKVPDAFDSIKTTSYVVDWTELAVENIICSKCDQPTAPEYVGGPKLKILLGFSECGLITYVSKAQSLAASKSVITDEEFISKVLNPNQDAIMDEGVFIEKKCRNTFIERIKHRKQIDSFMDTIDKSDFGSKKKVLDDRATESLNRFKLFMILYKKLPCELACYIDYISVIIAGIVNLNNTTLRDLEFNK